MEERTVERARAKVDRLYNLLNALKFFINYVKFISQPFGMMCQPARVYLFKMELFDHKHISGDT